MKSKLNKIINYLFYLDLVLVMIGSFLYISTNAKIAFALVVIGFLGFALTTSFAFILYLKRNYKEITRKLQTPKLKHQNKLENYYIKANKLIKLVGYVYIALFIIGMPLVFLVNIPIVVLISISIAIGLVLFSSILFLYFLVKRPVLIIKDIKQNLWIIVATIIFSILISLSQFSKNLTISDYFILGVIVVSILLLFRWILSKKKEASK